MASWHDVEADAPELAAAVRARFSAGRHCTLATLRRDGAPRISGTEVAFDDGEIRIGSMGGARKLADLERDPRFALHSPTVDPPEAVPSDWPGEAKVAGRALAVSEEAAAEGEEATAEGDQPDDAVAFRLELDEVVFTKVEGDELVITSWHPGRGVEVHRRA